MKTTSTQLHRPTTRREFVAASVALVGSTVAARWARADDAAASQPASRPAMFSGKLQTQKLEDDLAVLSGAGGNVAAHFSEDRLLVIDSGIPQRAPELLRLVRALSPKARLGMLVNTHWHYDHCGGDSAFVGEGFRVAGSGKCRQRLGETITNEDMHITSTPLPLSARPTITFDQQLTLHEVSDLTLTKIAPAHTDTDAVAMFEKYNILHTGDLLFANMFPVIDRFSGGSLDGMIASSKQLLTMLNEKSRVIPGHGAMGDRSTVAAQLELLQTVHDRLAPLGEQKKTLKEVLELRPLADLDSKWGTGFLKSDAVTPMYYGQWL